jgi:hypothetical protein
MLESEMYGLEAYLSRSETSDMKVPLYIELMWLAPKDRAGDHAVTCGVSPLEVFNCPETPCKLAVLLQAQLHQIFAVLFGINRDNCASQTRLNRWTTLKADMRHFWDGGLTMGIVTLLPIQKDPIMLSFPNLQSISIQDLATDYPPLHLPKLKRLELEGASALIDSPSISCVQFFRLGEFYPRVLRRHFPWASCQVEVLEVNRFDYDIVEVENPLPTLTTLIFAFGPNVYVNWNSISRRFNAKRPLPTVILLGFPILGLDFVGEIPELHIQNWKLSCSCYKRSPRDIIPSYSTKFSCCEKSKAEVNAARDFLTMIKQRGVQAEGLDTCMTRLFEDALREEVHVVQE